MISWMMAVWTLGWWFIWFFAGIDAFNDQYMQAMIVLALLAIWAELRRDKGDDGNS